MKDTILLLLLLGAVGWGYMTYQSGEFSIVRNAPPAPPVLIQDTYQPAVPAVLSISPSVTPWTPPVDAIDFNATTEAYFSQEPVVLIATRPAFESLPPVGPYTPQQVETCQSVWEQGLDGQLMLFQMQYELCHSSLLDVGYFK